MALHRFFLDEQVIAAEDAAAFPLRLSPDDARHAKVVRLAAGEHVAVIDAAQDYFECEVVDATGELPIVRVAQHLDAPSMPDVVLVQGLCKGDKMDDVVRHATELGVGAFVPLACERSVVRLDEAKARKRVGRWRAIAKSAAMQSGQARVPEVSMPMGVREAADMLTGATAVLVCWEEAPAAASMRAALTGALVRTGTPAADARIAVVVGPEGGLSAAEVDRLCAASPYASAVTLGPSILRTETAGIVAPALALYELGFLGASEGAA